jgi:hypothetical protein
MFMDSGLAGYARAPKDAVFEFPDSLFHGNGHVKFWYREIHFGSASNSKIGGVSVR